MPSRDPARKTARHAAAQSAVPEGAGLIPYLAVLICVAAGIYIAWHQGGGHAAGRGGVVAGAALLVAAVLRLALPARVAGLLAVRHRGTDAVTLIALGACLLTVGLALPGLLGRHPHKGAVLAQRPGRLADERETRKCQRSR